MLESLEMDRVLDVEVSPKAMCRDQPEQLRSEQHLRYARVLDESVQLDRWIADFVGARSQLTHQNLPIPRRLGNGHQKGYVSQVDKAIPQNAQNPV